MLTMRKSKFKQNKISLVTAVHVYIFFPAITRNAKAAADHAVYAIQVHGYKSSSTGITEACCTHSPFVTMPLSS